MSEYDEHLPENTPGMGSQLSSQKDNLDAGSAFSESDFSLPSSKLLSNNSVVIADSASSPQPNNNRRNIQDMSLAEFVVNLVHSPITLGKTLWDLSLPGAKSGYLVDEIITVPREYHPAAWDRGVRSIVAQRRVIQIAFWAAAFVIALAGNLIMRGDGLERRSETVQLIRGLPLLLVGVMVWLVGEIVGYWPDLVQWWHRKDYLERFGLVIRAFPIGLVLVGIGVIWDSTDAPTEDVLGIVTPGVQLVLIGMAIWVVLDVGNCLLGELVIRRPASVPGWMRFAYTGRKSGVQNQAARTIAVRDPFPWYMKISIRQLVFALGGTILLVVIWYGTSANRFKTPTFYLWLSCIALWSLAFAPRDWNPLIWAMGWFHRLRHFRWRKYTAVIVALLVICGIGYYFRFHNLRLHPREMTDDHVEKILDSGLVRNGERPIFFANNGGREPFQMYAIALASYLPGLGINHFTIKVVAAVESLITIPILFWMGYELTKGESQRTRFLVGLLVSGLTAVSYWHVAITRQALRIALTPLVSALLLIYLARALRGNHRADFIKTGLILGFGLYMYQAVRMLPVVIVVAVILAFYFTADGWKSRLRYAANLLVLIWISFVVFLPMFHYSVEFPDLFWRRTAGRLLGDDVIEEKLADGTIVVRDASLDERWTAFQDNVPVLMSNIRNVLLMFNWKGDVAAISGVPNQPSMDVVSGTLLIIGLAAWVSFMVRKRDVAIWLIPLFIFIMLLPSALSIAFPVENPSHTRTSGAIPAIYLVAALPLAVFTESVMALQLRRMRTPIVVILCSAAILASFNANAYTYFQVYPKIYSDSFDPYSEPGDYLRGFALSGGSFGNAFMIGYPHWWSHRAIGLAAGLETLWPNGIVDRQDIPQLLRDHASRTDQFRFDANRDIVFFISPKDAESLDYLRQIFPNGYDTLQQTYALNNDYIVFRVPALGEADFPRWIAEHLVQ